MSRSLSVSQSSHGKPLLHFSGSSKTSCRTTLPEVIRRKRELPIFPFQNPLRHLQTHPPQLSPRFALKCSRTTMWAATPRTDTAEHQCCHRRPTDHQQAARAISLPSSLMNRMAVAWAYSAISGREIRVFVSLAIGWVTWKGGPLKSPPGVSFSIWWLKIEYSSNWIMKPEDRAKKI